MTTSGAGAIGFPERRSSLQGAALVVGGAFLLIGVLGFIPVITDYDGGMKIAGHEHGAMLLHLFHVSVLHNIVHLTFGVAGVLLARTFNRSRAFLVGGGLVYLVLWLYGLLINKDSSANFIPVNTADNWLHLALGVVMILFGVVLSRAAANRPAGTAVHGPTSADV